MVKPHKNLLILAQFFWLIPGIAQVSESESPNPADFSLFENIEEAASRPTGPSARPSRESRATVAEPIFTLIGTSRIGNQSSAILRHQSGEIVRVPVDPNTAMPIDGYEEYSVFEVDAGSLSVRLPANIPCVDFKDKGVSCTESPNIARLQLVNGEALARVVAPTDGIQPPESNQTIDGQGVSDLSNPFEALRAARASGRSLSAGQPQEAANNQSGRFTPRRIPPEDVPPGMRVVSTPFGDRLVEQ